MRAYPLRLKDDLAEAARLHADSVGVSFNALVAIALDAYLHGQPGTGKTSKRQPSTTKARRPPKPSSNADKPSPGTGRFDLWHRDPRNWRNFHEPDQWPWADPDWSPPLGVKDPYSTLGPGDDPNDVTPEQIKAFEDAYWSTHERPLRPWFEESEIPH